MKKIFALILALSMLFCFVACGQGATNSDPTLDNSSDITFGEDDGELNLDDENTLDLKEPNTNYVVVAMKKSAIKINSVNDFKNYTCAYLDDTDSAVWAEYYDFNGIGAYNSPNDLHSGVSGNQYQLGIVAEGSAAAYSDWEIIWQLKAE